MHANGVRVPYLLRPRLHFAGLFEADPPTANNAVEHYDITKFKPENVQRDRTNSITYGEYDPTGTGRFRISDCRVTKISPSDEHGASGRASDPIVGATVTDAADQVFAKMADLDPLQQRATQIFGLKIRILAADGTLLLAGDFLPSPFMDPWVRVKGALPAEPTIAAFYQSILAPISWGATELSPFVSELRRACDAGALSIKFNLDSYDPEWTRAQFGTGRIVGTIGVAAAGEPRTFVMGRQLLPSSDLKVNPMVAMLDCDLKRIVLDFGNSLPTTAVRGPLADLGPLQIAIGERVIGDVPPYAQKGFYEATAAIVEVPLSSGDLAAAEDAPLAIVSSTKPQNALWQEAPDGIYVRADDLIFRMSPGDVAEPIAYATRYGRPRPGLRILSVADPVNLNPHAGYNVQQPPDAIRYPEYTTSDSYGVAPLTIEARDPRCPRDWVDGQVYGVRVMPADGGLTKQYDVISIRVWNKMAKIDDPTWYDHILPILQQYANLYPAMRNVIDLSSYDDVVTSGNLLKFALSLPLDDPNHMPVTRDLSPAKRDLILQWLATKGNGGLPSLGTPPGELPVVPPLAPPITGGKAGELFPNGRNE